TVTKQVGIDPAHGDARLYPHPLAAVQNFYFTKVSASVDEEPVSDALPAEARSSGPEGDRMPPPVRRPEHVNHLVNRAGRGNCFGKQVVVRGVVSHFHAVKAPPTPGFFNCCFAGGCRHEFCASRSSCTAE